MEFTTSATEADKLTTTDNDASRILKKRFLKGLVATVECSDEATSGSDYCDKKQDHRYHHLAAIASSGDEEQVTTKFEQRQPEYIRSKLLAKHRKNSSNLPS